MQAFEDPAAERGQRSGAVDRLPEFGEEPSTAVDRLPEFGEERMTAMGTAPTFAAQSFADYFFCSASFLTASRIDCIGSRGLSSPAGGLAAGTDGAASPLLGSA